MMDSATLGARRAIWLLLGSFYLYLIAQLFSLLHSTPLWYTLPPVLLAAAAIMGSLCWYAVRTVGRSRNQRSFGLASLLLLMVPLSIYLAGIHWIVQPLARQNPNMPFWNWLVIDVFIGFGCIVTTVVLLCYAEALMWCAVWFKRGTKSSR